MINQREANMDRATLGDWVLGILLLVIIGLLAYLDIQKPVPKDPQPVYLVSPANEIQLSAPASAAEHNYEPPPP
jgi:hypothetical protein